MGIHLRRAHIQDHANAAGLETHWGYPDRVVPCVNDQGTCEYLDGVYRMHDLSMLYTFILWAVIGVILALWVAARILRPPERSTGLIKGRLRDTEASESKNGHSAVLRVWRAVVATINHYLLPESFTGVFGHVSRVQLVVLAGLLAYLLIFSLVGISYRTWITPVRRSPGKFNTRTGLGGFSDRVGALAYALTPLSILLSSRDSALSVLTGLPHTSFLFLHVWTGRIIFIQSFLHTLGWTIIEARLYQPQPAVYREFMSQLYIIFGVVAMLLITVLYLGSLRPVIRRTGYQVFKLTHYVTAAIYLAACWIHWTGLACWIIAAVILLTIDRGVRLIRLLLIHTGHLDTKNCVGFKRAAATIKLFKDEDGGQIVRLEFEHSHGPWRAGQHFFLTFPELAWWQAHPFTPASLSLEHPQWQRHVYVMRVKKGITRRLADLAMGGGGESSLDVLLTGPYGVGSEATDRSKNMLAIAGGTGISFVFPQVLQRAKNSDNREGGITELVWIVRKRVDIQWFLPEIEGLKKSIADRARYNEKEVDLCTDRVKISILVTRRSAEEPRATGSSASSPVTQDISKEMGKDTTFKDMGSSTVSERLDMLCGDGRFIRIKELDNHHPSIAELLDTFATSCMAGSIDVVGSGPSGLGSDLRSAVAELNNGSRVWRGDQTGYVNLVCDVREL